MKLTTLKKKANRLRGLLLGGLALPLAGYAQDSVDLKDYPNDSYLSLKGTVESVSPDLFTLSYNDDGDEVIVEMDDGDRDADAYKLLPGDEVTVYGVMDRDLFETRKIEASSVYVEKLNTFFSASAVDEEDYYSYYPLLTVVTTSQGNDADTASGTAKGSESGASTSDMNSPMSLLWVQGEVSDIQDDSFSLALGDRDINVQIDGLSDNPFDDQGYRQIQAGDVVSVMGNIDGNFFDDAQLAADSIVKIHDKEDI